MNDHAEAAEARIERDPLFVALTRPQMLAGVTYSFLVANLIVGIECFLLFRSAWILGIMVMAHLAGMGICARDPRLFDLWLARSGRCPRVRNHKIWKCNSYRP